MSTLRFVRGLQITDHAVERYIERVRPMLSERHARIELERLVRTEGVILDEPPEWMPTPFHGCAQNRAEAYVEIGDTGIICPVYRRMVLTVLVPGGLSPAKRERRNEKKRIRKARAKARQPWLDKEAKRNR